MTCQSINYHSPIDTFIPDYWLFLRRRWQRVCRRQVAAQVLSAAEEHEGEAGPEQGIEESGEEERGRVQGRANLDVNV